jgi:hypothetical protein
VTTNPSQLSGSRFSSNCFRITSLYGASAGQGGIEECLPDQMVDRKNHPLLIRVHDRHDVHYIVAWIGMHADPALRTAVGAIVPGTRRLPIIPYPVGVIALLVHPRLHHPEPLCGAFPVNEITGRVEHHEQPHRYMLALLSECEKPLLGSRRS